jgi:uncharacterized protein YjbI with pentapeptide repeats
MLLDAQYSSQPVVPSEHLAGKQPMLSKLLLFSLALIAIGLASMIIGYQGAGVFLHVFLYTQYAIIHFLVTLITLMGFAVAICLGFTRSVLLVLGSIIVASLGARLLSSLNLFQPSYGFSYTLIGNLVIQLVICIVGFLVFRFVFGLIDVLCDRPSRFKTITYLLIGFLSVVAAINAFGDFQIEEPTGSRTLLEYLTVFRYEVAKLTSIIGGVVFSFAIALGAKFTNQFKSPSWKYPNPWRNMAIATASWRATSFYDHDLSNINFSGIKLANTDLRAKKLYRTQFQGSSGLERARVDSRYLDLEYPKVQKLLTRRCSEDRDFSRLTLRGAYLKGADLRHMQFVGTDLSGADLSGADLRDSVLLRAIVTDVDFTGADLTGACIKDWSFNSETRFEQVTCNYIYREYEDDRPTDRYPADRNFEPGEFQSLFQKLTNAIELVFKDQVDWRALSFTFEKFRVEDDGLELELKGVEQRGDYWIVKVTHREGVPRQEVEHKVTTAYDDIRLLLESKDQEINRLVGINTQLMGIMTNQTSTLQNQSEALKNYSKQPFGNSFYITGSTITNLAGSGQIDYAEAAKQVRSIVAQGSNPAQMNQTLQQFVSQIQGVAATPEQQAELLQQLILSEAENDAIFKSFLLQQEQSILATLPSGFLAQALQGAIAHLA